jgi:hypothetical protein
MLYRRFVAWTLPEDGVCRLCSGRGHDVIAGMSPRLVPCKKIVEVIPPVRRPPRGWNGTHKT